IGISASGAVVDESGAPRDTKEAVDVAFNLAAAKAADMLIEAQHRATAIMHDAVAAVEPLLQERAKLKAEVAELKTAATPPKRVYPEGTLPPLKGGRRG